MRCGGRPRKAARQSPRLSHSAFALNVHPMLRRRLPLLFVCLACLAGLAPARAAQVEFLRVWPGWRTAESFDRIGEYFGRGENSRRQPVLRTQAAERGGYYFLVRVKNAAALADARFEVSVIRPDNPDAKTYTFPLALPARETVVQLGLTGADWPGGQQTNPVAWKIALVGADGRALAEHASFLWAKPAK